MELIPALGVVTVSLNWSLELVFHFRWIASESCGTYYRDCRNKPASKTDIAVVISVLVTLFALICVCIGCCFHAQNRQRRIINGNLSGTRQTAPVWSVYNDEHSRPPRSAGRVLEEPPPKYEDIPPIYEHAVIDLAAQRKPASLPAIETETSRF